MLSAYLEKKHIFLITKLVSNEPQNIFNIFVKRDNLFNLGARGEGIYEGNHSDCFKLVIPWLVSTLYPLYLGTRGEGIYEGNYSDCY